MTEKALEQIVLNLAQPLVAALGLEIWGLEIVPSGRPVVRLFVDLPQSAPDDPAHAAPPAGQDAGESAESGDLSLMPERSASIDQCEEISRQLGLALDVEDCIPTAWNLEVSTPGLSRRFFRLAQMRPYLGDVVEVRLETQLAGSGRRAYMGILRDVADGAFTIEPCSVSGEGEISPEGEAVVIPWDQVARARRHYIFAQPARPGRQSGKRKSGATPEKGRPPEEK